MSESISLPDRYLQLIDKIVDTTLKGKIRSQEQVYQMLLREVESGTGEIFERALSQRQSAIQSQIDRETDELKQAKANRKYRALQTIAQQWERWEKENKVAVAISQAVNQIFDAEPQQRLTALLRAIDPNQPEALTQQQQQKLAKFLQQKLEKTNNPELSQQILPLAMGLKKGWESWQQLEQHLVSWIYDRGKGSLGFGGVPGEDGPWALWSKKLNRPFPKALLNTLAFNRSFSDFLRQQPTPDMSEWVETTVIFQSLQRGLVAWFDKMVYDSKVGAKLSISTYLTFAVIWSQLANAVRQSAGLNSTSREQLANACFQVTLQILRAFAQRDYFPLYGGIFAAFTGEYLRGALEYLSEPLRRVEGTEEKARILTLLGYSMRTMGEYERALGFHEQALEISRDFGDRPCEIASLNHLSRTFVAQKNYQEAIRYSQQALVLSRQAGDRLSEANALATLGFSEVFQARDRGELEPEVYEVAINYLQQGLALAERGGDRQSQALCFSSLGIAYVEIDRYQEAIGYLQNAWEAAQISGDLYLQGLTLGYLAQAFFHQSDLPKTIFFGALGMYRLEQIQATEWRRIAGLLTIVKGQLGESGFQDLLAEQRRNFLPAIGVDGYDYLPELLEKYQRSLE